MRPAILVFSLWLCFLSGLSACSVRDSEPESETATLMQIAPEKLSDEERSQLIGEVGNNYVYGQGVGKTMLNIGSVVLFPPYAAYLLGNTLLEVGGYEPLEISSALPEQQKESWNKVYDRVTGGPGRMIAAVAGEEYRSQEIAKEKLLKFTKQSDTSAETNGGVAEGAVVVPQFYEPNALVSEELGVIE